MAEKTPDKGSSRRRVGPPAWEDLEDDGRDDQDKVPIYRHKYKQTKWKFINDRDGEYACMLENNQWIKKWKRVNGKWVKVVPIQVYVVEILFRWESWFADVQ